MSDQPAAGWYVDPTHRFEHRYWDGTTWTEHVSRNGHATTDPLDGSGATTSVADVSADDGSTGEAWDATFKAQTGGPTPWETQTRPGTRTNSKAIVSLVLSLLWVGGLGSVAAIILGVMAKREIQERADEGGTGVATAGIVIGIIGVIGAALAFLAALALFSAGFAP